MYNIQCLCAASVAKCCTARSVAGGEQSATAQERSQSESCLHCGHLDFGSEKLRCALDNVDNVGQCGQTLDNVKIEQFKIK